MGRFGGGRIGRRWRWGRRGGRCQRSECGAQRCVKGKHTEVAVAVNAWCRDESGEAAWQLQRRRDLRAVAVQTSFRGLVEQLSGIEFA